MMMGEGAHAPPWQHAVSGPEGGGYTGAGDDVALRDYLPSNEAAAAAGVGEDDEDAAAYACDEFRMYEFKVRRCARGRSHDWTDCPFAHPGEKARRRDPRRYCYSGTACPDFRKGGCKRGDACEFAHGVFECWLHPARYRTQACKDGTACCRRVCFFAHTPDQLRALPQHQQGSSPRSVASSPLAESYDGSPLRRQAFESYLNKSMTSSSLASILVSPPGSPPSESPPVSPDQLRSLPQHQQGSSPRSVASSPLAESYDGSLLRRQAFESYLSKMMMLSSPTSTLVSPPRSSPSESPPLSPDAAGGFHHGSWPRVGPPVNDVLTSLRQLRLGSPKLAPFGGSFLAGYNTAFESPKSPVGQYIFPSTPTRSSLVTVTTASGATMTMEPMDLGLIAEEQPVERVESGRALRAKVFERLSKEATVCNDTIAAAAVEVPTSAAPDVGWVSDLIN